MTCGKSNWLAFRIGSLRTSKVQQKLKEEFKIFVVQPHLPQLEPIQPGNFQGNLIWWDGPFKN